MTTARLTAFCWYRELLNDRRDNEYKALRLSDLAGTVIKHGAKLNALFLTTVSMIDYPLAALKKWLRTFF